MVRICRPGLCKYHLLFLSLAKLLTRTSTFQRNSLQHGYIVPNTMQLLALIDVYTENGCTPIKKMQEMYDGKERDLPIYHIA
ncbi:hypothetical protein BGZ63DRAFT_374303 [Mariannaea sp. PMI_226]|nr:hypothetical protein BGZ63DRAFT_374303 [Mariannaea sp. PMI_226]